METTNNKCSQCIYNDNCIERNPEECPSFINKDYVSDTITISEEVQTFGYEFPQIKSHLTIGNMVFHNTHRFSWLERKMWKLLLGFDIENVEE